MDTKWSSSGEQTHRGTRSCKPPLSSTRRSRIGGMSEPEERHPCGA